LEIKAGSLLQRRAGDVQKRPGSSADIIMAGDVIYLKAHTGKYIDAENGAVACHHGSRGATRMFRIEKDGNGGIHYGDTISLRSHEDKHVGVTGTTVTSNWGTYESQGDISSYEDISLLARDGEDWDPDGSTPSFGTPDDGFSGGGAGWGEGGTPGGGTPPDGFPGGGTGGTPPDGFPGGGTGWGEGGIPGGGTPGSGTLPPLPGGIQVAFQLENPNGGTDVVRVGDQIYLRAFTTKQIDVQGTTVQAQLSDSFAPESALTVERDPKPLPPTRPVDPSRPPGPDAITAGDTIYLRAYSGKHIHVDRNGGIGASVRCDWDEHGHRQALRIMKTAGGYVHQGDTVYLKTWYHTHLLVDRTYIRDQGEGSWRPDQAFIIERHGAGASDSVIFVNDTIHLRAHTGKYLDVHQPWCTLCCATVQVRYEYRSGWENQKFTIERDAGPPPSSPAAPTDPAMPSGTAAPTDPWPQDPAEQFGTPGSGWS